MDCVNDDPFGQELEYAAIADEEAWKASARKKSEEASSRTSLFPYRTAATEPLKVARGRKAPKPLRGEAERLLGQRSPLSKELPPADLSQSGVEAWVSTRLAFPSAPKDKASFRRNGDDDAEPKTRSPPKSPDRDDSENLQSSNPADSVAQRPLFPVAMGETDKVLSPTRRFFAGSPPKFSPPRRAWTTTSPKKPSGSFSSPGVPTDGSLSTKSLRSPSSSKENRRSVLRPPSNPSSPIESLRPPGRPNRSPGLRALRSTQNMLDRDAGFPGQVDESGFLKIRGEVKSQTEQSRA